MVELVHAKDEHYEEVGGDAEEELEDPSKEGHVDVEHISLLALPECVGMNDVCDGVSVLCDVAEGERI